MDYDPDWMGWTIFEAFFALAACLKVHVRMPLMLRLLRLRGMLTRRASV